MTIVLLFRDRTSSVRLSTLKHCAFVISTSVRGAFHSNRRCTPLQRIPLNIYLAERCRHGGAVALSFINLGQIRMGFRFAPVSGGNTASDFFGGD